MCEGVLELEEGKYDQSICLFHQASGYLRKSETGLFKALALLKLAVDSPQVLDSEHQLVEAALKECRDARDLAPDSSDALWLLAVCEWVAGARAQAIKSLNLAIEHAEDTLPLHISLKAIFMAHSGLVSEAIDLQEEAVSGQDRDPLALAVLAKLHLFRGEVIRAKHYSTLY
jgi:tetratricopeptide (TPR) repeat protein